VTVSTRPEARLSATAHIAILDDEVEITLLLANYLKGHGFRVTQLHDGRSLMRLMADDAPALVLLDLGLPGEDGFSIARRLREHWRCGLVIVTGRGDAVDKVVGLEIGADDYVTKPFDLRELVARVKAVLRRVVPADPAVIETAGQGAPRETLQFGGWALDLPARRLVDPRGAEVGLTSGEFDLLCAFAKHPGRVLSRDFLLGETRGREAGPFDRTVDVQVGRLRKKLGDEGDDPKIIKSVRSAGYVFVPAVTAD
jgi:two-component system, OmpR family, response regulator